jgi:hypothetical protein
MKMPMLHGSCPHRDFFIYSACDQHYFDQFGKTFVQSVKDNSDHLIHVHLYNPRDDQLSYCDTIEGLSYTYEQLDFSVFNTAAQRLDADQTSVQYQRSNTAMKKSNDNKLSDRIAKTYYACARFIRLWEIITPNTCTLAVDSDAVVRSSVPLLSERDFYIHHVAGKNPRYLAGGIMLPGGATGYNFLSDYAQELLKHIEQDHIYWSLDQDVLDNIVTRYQWGQLPKSYIDWDMQPDSYIWTAKGQRKDQPVFINEQQKYTV